MENDEKIELKLRDLENAVKVIDVAATRGAFRGPEMSSVGAVRDKLASFVTAAAPPAEDAATEEPDTEQEAETIDGNGVSADAQNEAQKARSRKPERAPATQ